MPCAMAYWKAWLINFPATRAEQPLQLERQCLPRPKKKEKKSATKEIEQTRVLLWDSQSQLLSRGPRSLSRPSMFSTCTCCLIALQWDLCIAIKFILTLHALMLNLSNVKLLHTCTLHVCTLSIKAHEVDKFRPLPVKYTSCWCDLF